MSILSVKTRLPPRLFRFLRCAEDKSASGLRGKGGVGGGGVLMFGMP